MLPALAMGVSDSVPGSFMSPLHNKIRETYNSGDIQSAQQAQVCTMHIIEGDVLNVVASAVIHHDDLVR